MPSVSTAGSVTLFDDNRKLVPLSDPQQLALAAAVLCRFEMRKEQEPGGSFYVLVANRFGFGPNYIRRNAIKFLRAVYPGLAERDGANHLWALTGTADILKSGYKPPALIMTNIPCPSIDTLEAYENVLALRNQVNDYFFPSGKEVRSGLREIERLLDTNDGMVLEVCLQRLDLVETHFRELLARNATAATQPGFLLERAKLNQQRLWFWMEDGGGAESATKFYERAIGDLAQVLNPSSASSLEQRVRAKEVLNTTKYTFAVYCRQYDATLELDELKKGWAEEKALRREDRVLDWVNEIGHSQLSSCNSASALETFREVLLGRKNKSEQGVAMFNMALALAKLKRWEESVQIGGVANRTQEMEGVTRTKFDQREYEDWVTLTKEHVGDTWQSLYVELDWGKAMRRCRKLST